MLFPPDVSRPVRLALVHLENRSDEPLIVDYTETWDLARDGYRVAEAAAVAETRDGLRALADASVAPRARPPRQTPAVGLALDLRLALPAGARRPLAFVYAAPEPDEEPHVLVRAFRGMVAVELERTLEAWRASQYQ